jgi:glycine cleavage system H protein
MPLVFMMGRSPAFLATDRRYVRNHMWIRPVGEALQLGFSSYAVRLLGDIHHLQWSVAPGGAVSAGQVLGFIEGSKATSDLYAPLAGTVVELNPRVLAEPALLNSELYEDAWLLALRGQDDLSLTPEEYLAHLEACWPLAQRLLKGQANRQSGGDG